METIKVKYDGIEAVFNKGTRLLDIAAYFDNGTKEYVGAIIENTVHNMFEEINEDVELEFIDANTKDGHDILFRTATLIFLLAAKRIFPDELVVAEHTMNDGLYLTLDSKTPIKHNKVKEIKEEMQRIIQKDYKIIRKKIQMDDAYYIFNKENYQDRIKLYDTLDFEDVNVYEVSGHYFTFHGYIAPSTGFIEKFDVISYYPGVMVMIPTPESDGEVPEFREEKTLAKIFSNSKKWMSSLNINSIGELNEKILNNDIDFLVEVAEAYFENQVSDIASSIVKDEDADMVLIAGPSSSGKTTLAHRLSVQLGVRGIEPIPIHMDDYFVNREDTPIDENGERNYELLEAIDLEKFNEDLMLLIEGEEIELPSFNFVTGKREKSGRFIKLGENSIVIIEGIHALNPKLTKLVPDKNKFKIYVSALTQLNIDAHNRISSSDVRLLRRMVRDNQFRGTNIESTLNEWPKVRAGETKFIFPYQDFADVAMDSSLIYELAVIKKYAMDLFKDYDKSNKNYKEIKRLSSLLKYFVSIEDDSIIPNNSIIRETIGKGRKG